MFRSLFFDSAMLLWAGIPILLAGVLFAVGLAYWWNQVKDGAVYKYSGEVFRDPTNAALTVSGFFIPLLCGGIGYLIERSVPPRQLVPLLAATILFGLSVMVGLWNLFAMTSFKNGDGKIEIKKDGVWGYVAQFATQLFIMFGGIIVVLLYFLFFFDLKPEETKTASASPTIMMARPPVRAGMTSRQVLDAWGAPIQRTNSALGDCWLYDAPESEFGIVFRSNAVWIIQERRK